MSYWFYLNYEFKLKIYNCQTKSDKVLSLEGNSPE